MRRFLLQMAGESGSGKSTLARAIAGATGAVVLDEDVIMSAAMAAGVEKPLAGAVAYEAGFDLARSVLEQGHSVIFDSAAFFVRIREKGRTIAAAADADYRLIECDLSSVEQRQARLRERPPLPSQPAAVEEALTGDRPGTAPLTEPRLTLDTSRPLEEQVALALAYLEASAYVRTG